MPIFKLNSNDDFIESLTDFLLLNYHKRFEDLIIIMESGLACKLLQDSLIEKMASPFFFPEIIPIFSSETSEMGTYFYNIILEEEGRLIITKILLKNNLINNFADGFNISKHIYKLYNEFIFNDLLIKNLKPSLFSDLSEQSYKNINLINKVLTEYELYQKKTDRSDISRFQKELLLNVNNNNYYKNKKIILASIDPSNKLLFNFINNIIKNKGDYIGDNIDLVKAMDNNEQIYEIESNIVEREPDEQKSLIREFENEFEEVRYILNICKKNTHSKILIVSDNLYLNNILTINFDKNDIEYTNYTYSESKKDNFIDLFINIADFCLSDFEIKKFLLIIKSPLIINSYIYEIEYKVLRKKTYIPNLKFLLKDVESLCSEKTYIWFTSFCKKISQLFKSVNSNFIEQHILVAKELCTINMNEYEKYFDLVKTLSIYFEAFSSEDYISYLKNIKNDFFIQMQTTNSNIIISTIKDSKLISKANLVVIPSFSDNYWSETISQDILINNFIRSRIGLPNNDKNHKLNIIIKLIQNSEIYITYAKKSNGEVVTHSKYLNLIKSFLKNLKFSSSLSYNYFTNPIGDKADIISVTFKSELMPDKISGTNIEMLIRNPYGFYAKHILKLRKLKNPIPELQFSEFGIFIHSVLEEYTKNYNSKDEDKLSIIINIAQSIHTKLNNLYQTPYSWLHKFNKIAKSFIDFDESRRINLAYVLTEAYGEMDISLSKRIIKITAIADRIEVTKNNEIYIIDYKTGALPTLKSINEGLSPQLILEALIAKHGYFQNLDSKIISQIIYVKISLSEPYFTITKIDLDENILELHLNNLKKLLEYYYEPEIVSIKKSELETAPQYNDYIHMLRNLA
jgi:RecB family exonuclease